LEEMKEQDYSQGRMSRETGLSYNTVKKYLGRLKGPADPPDPSVDGAGRA
jgi:transposase